MHFLLSWFFVIVTEMFLTQFVWSDQSNSNIIAAMYIYVCSCVHRTHCKIVLYTSFVQEICVYFLGFFFSIHVVYSVFGCIWNHKRLFSLVMSCSWNYNIHKLAVNVVMVVLMWCARPKNNKKPKYKTIPHITSMKYNWILVLMVIQHIFVDTNKFRSTQRIQKHTQGLDLQCEYTSLIHHTRDVIHMIETENDRIFDRNVVITVVCYDQIIHRLNEIGRNDRNQFRIAKVPIMIMITLGRVSSAFDLDLYYLCE